MAVKITIIGAGPGGYAAAVHAARLGAEVTLVERENVGGTCLNWGCIPSKIMKTTADMLENFRRAPEFGIRVTGEVGPDMERLTAGKEKIIEDQAKGMLNILDKHKIRYLRGVGFIKDFGLAAVKLPNNQTIDLEWDRLILALGTQPRPIPLFPFDGEKIISSNEALCLRQVPESLIIVGAGVIGCEFAFIFASLGSRVTVVEAMSRILPLPSVDEEASKVLGKEMKKRKIKFIPGRTVEKVEKNEKKVCVILGRSPFNKEVKKKDPSHLTMEAEKMLVCIGRNPDTSGIGLEKLGVEKDNQGWILVNERMETNIPHVYAIGDILGPSKIMLAHVASTEGRVAAQNAMGGKRIMNYDIVPAAIFTMPEVANVGLTEAQAIQQGYRVQSDSVLFRTIGKAQVIGEIEGHAKIISNAENEKILGVHIVGPHASELIAEATLAMQMKGTIKDLAETIHAHPTLAEIMLEVSLKRGVKDSPLF